jgi:hypothetical protein
MRMNLFLCVSLAMTWLPPPDDAIPSSGNNPAFLAAIQEEKRFVPYEHRYLSMTGLDTGAYLTVPAGPRAPNWNSRLGFDIPPDWPPGEYVARIRCVARSEAAADRRFMIRETNTGSGATALR